jgi:hypothetical protein
MTFFNFGKYYVGFLIPNAPLHLPLLYVHKILTDCFSLLLPDLLLVVFNVLTDAVVLFFVFAKLDHHVNPFFHFADLRLHFEDLGCFCSFAEIFVGV